ncbi:MAG: hypothetical protein EXR98_09230 [Gemmataceae bacterium]|nr:hypothetical protein [Gemmataceae bacterium]
MSSDELADIVAYGGFRHGPNCLTGKWFAETPETARRWGEFLYQDQASVFHVIQVDVPLEIVDQMFRLSSLDQIGPARYAEGEVLALINQQQMGFAEVS